MARRRRSQRRGRRAASGVQPVGVEVVKCADCPRTFERPIVPKGRPRLYCTKSCANYASRRRIKGTTGLTPVKVAMGNWLAQRRAAPPLTFSQAVEALRGLPDLHAILSGAAIQSEHGHEAPPSGALPPRPRARERIPPKRNRNQPLTEHAQRAKGRQSEH